MIMFEDERAFLLLKYAFGMLTIKQRCIILNITRSRYYYLQKTSRLSAFIVARFNELSKKIDEDQL